MSHRLGSAFVAVLLLGARPARAATDITALLDTCPQHDVAYAQIRSDFEIRRNQVPVGDIPCTEPISQLPAAAFTDELLAVQTLRAALYMDPGTTTLPWAPGMRLYDWLKSKGAGIDISNTATKSSCCEDLGGKKFFIRMAENDAQRDPERGLLGVTGNLSLFAHELRHLDPFPHVRCCPAQDPNSADNACDQTYDEANLSPYGIQYWLNAHWLTGDLYTGFSCLSASSINDAMNYFGSGADAYIRNFCTNPPPAVPFPPANPGGQCRTPLKAVDLLIVVDLSGSFFDDLPVFQTEAPAVISHLASVYSDLHVGLAGFQDYPIAPFGDASLGDKAYALLDDLTSDQSSVLTTIAGLQVVDNAGADGPQSQLAALYQAATGAGQDLSSQGFPGASIPAGQGATFRAGATKLVLLWTDAAFHEPGDPGAIPYPGPTFSATVAALQALDPARVIGISSGGGGMTDLQAIAGATGALAPSGGVDCDNDGVVDVPPGAPMVCAISSSGPGIGDALVALAGGAVADATPVARCQSTTVTAGSGKCSASASVDAGSFDPDGGPVTLAEAPPGPYPLGQNPVTLTATDSSGLSGSCAATITVVDATAPEIAPGASSISVCTSKPQDVAIPLPTIFDACGGAVVPQGTVIGVHGKSIAPTIPLVNGHATLPPGPILVRWTAQDPSGNQSQLDQQLTIVNNVAATCCNPAQSALLGTSGNDDLEAPLLPTRSYCALGFAGNDEIETRAGNDFLSGADGNDFLDSDGGNDTLVGGPGDDHLDGGIGGALLAYAGAGNDTVDATLSRSSEIFGNEGNDLIFGGNGSDVIYPGSGRDQVFANAGNDTVTIFNVCEVASLEILDGGLGADTLVTPVPVSTLRAMGVTVTGFESVVVDSSRAYLSDCF